MTPNHGQSFIYGILKGTHNLCLDICWPFFKDKGCCIIQKTLPFFCDLSCGRQGRTKKFMDKLLCQKTCAVSTNTPPPKRFIACKWFLRSCCPHDVFFCIRYGKMYQILSTKISKYQSIWHFENNFPEILTLSQRPRLAFSSVSSWWRDGFINFL